MILKASDYLRLESLRNSSCRTTGRSEMLYWLVGGSIFALNLTLGLLCGDGKSRRGFEYVVLL